MKSSILQLQVLLILFLIILTFGCENKPGTTKPEFWVWMHADAKRTIPEWELDIKKLKDSGFKGILMGANSEVLKTTIPIAKKYGLEVHAWMWTMNRGDADTSWLSVNQLGNSLAQHKAYVDYYKFMCPALPEVKKFIKAKIDELAEIEGLDGIHLDYIRYVDAILPVGLQPKYGLKQDSVFPEFDYGYHPYMVNLYKAKTGINPFDLKNPATDPEWLQFRLDELNKTVVELREHIQDHGLKATAAVFPTPAMARQMVRQEWNTWTLDCYYPMVYNNFYNENFDWVRDVMIENKSTLSAKENVICGLYVPALKNEADFRKAISSALEGGADGLAFFDFRAMDDNLFEIIKEIKKSELQQ